MKAWKIGALFAFIAFVVVTMYTTPVLDDPWLGADTRPVGLVILSYFLGRWVLVAKAERVVREVRRHAAMEAQINAVRDAVRDAARK